MTTQDSDSGLVPCPTCDGGAIGFGQTNAGIFQRCPQCDGRTEVPPESDSSPKVPECCHTEDGLPYCGEPECDIYYCQDCGNEFDEPCDRHKDTAHV